MRKYLKKLFGYGRKSEQAIKALVGHAVYVTYDLEESGPVPPEEVYRGAKRVNIPGVVLGWEVGEFKRGWGRDVYGVKISYRPRDSKVAAVREELVEVPANAQNVEIRLGSLPAEYQGGLQDVA